MRGLSTPGALPRVRTSHFSLLTHSSLPGFSLLTPTSLSPHSHDSRPQELITELIKASPSFKPPPDWRPEKKSRKLRIPIEAYPGYNFIGLIIGPRGNTQKRMERVRAVLHRRSMRCAALRGMSVHVFIKGSCTCLSCVG